MKDPKVEKLVVEFKDTLNKLNKIYAELDKEDVWLSLDKTDKTKGDGWEIRHLEQKVKY